MVVVVGGSVVVMDGCSGGQRLRNSDVVRDACLLC